MPVPCQLAGDERRTPFCPVCVLGCRPARPVRWCAGGSVACLASFKVGGQPLHAAGQPCTASWDASDRVACPSSVPSSADCLAPVQVYGLPFGMSRRLGKLMKPYTTRRDALVTSIREGIHGLAHPVINCLFCGRRKDHAASQLVTQTSSQMHVA